MGELTNLRGTIEALFPWVRGVLLSTRALVITSATKLIELAGGGPGVARVGDEGTQLAFYPGTPAPSYTAPSLWKSDDRGATWSQVTSTIITGPLPGEQGTPVKIVTGSERVTCG